MTITMPRGDIQTVIFTLTDPMTGEAPVIELTDIYFTVKKTWDDQEYIFQKSFSAGDIELVSGSTYQFVIDAEDTDGLAYGQYNCDIELVGPGLKQTFAGNLKLTYEATHAENEGG